MGLGIVSVIIAEEKGAWVPLSARYFGSQVPMEWIKIRTTFLKQMHLHLHHHYCEIQVMSFQTKAYK
jgi:hypothetical protein